MGERWILAITTDNACHLVRGGRARWKIENETFNTLKNQGYHVEHNFGHGKENLSVVFLMLMVLAFLIDQTHHFRFASMCYLYEVMLGAPAHQALRMRA